MRSLDRCSLLDCDTHRPTLYDCTDHPHSDRPRRMCRRFFSADEPSRAGKDRGAAILRRRVGKAMGCAMK